MVPTPTFVTDNEERRADGFPSRQAGASDRPLPLIWVTCYGSRGDLQPFVALALGLKAAGFRVAMLVPADFEGFVQSAGVDCVPIFADSEAGMSDPECKEFLAKGDLLSFLIWLEKLNKLNLPGTLKRFSAALRAERPDMIVCSTLTELYARLAWLKYLVPFVKVDLQRNPFMKTAKCRAFWGLPDLPLGLTRVISRQLLHGLYKNCQGHDDTVMELEGVKPMANMPWNDFRGRMVVDENYPIHAPTILAATSLFDVSACRERATWFPTSQARNA